MRQQNRDYHRPQTGRGAQHSEPRRTGVQNFARIHRQQRNGPTQQHGKEIQGHAAENQFAAPDIAESVQNHSAAVCRFWARRDVQPNRRQQRHRDQVHDSRAGVNRRWAGSESINQTSRHRSENRRGLEKRRSPRHRVREMFCRHQLRQEGLARGRIEGPNRAIGQEDCVNRPSRSDAIETQREQRDRAESEPAIADSENGLARVPVRRMSGGEEQQNTGRELRQAHQAEIQRLVRQCVDLPAHRHRDHF